MIAGRECRNSVDLCVRDLRLDAPAQIRLTSKGRKTHIVPLLSNTVDLLEGYLREHQFKPTYCVDSPLFFNQRGEHLSRSGVRYILEKYTMQARKTADLLLTSVTPHTLRLLKAMHLLQAGNPATVIQAILGHADIRTTNVSAQADIEMKRRALEKAASTASPTALLSWQGTRA